MTVYRTGHSLVGLGQSVTINSVEKDGRGEIYTIPVARLHIDDVHLPWPLEQLSGNMIAMLNNEEPPHKIDAGGHRIFYQRTPSALLVRWQKDGEGVSQEAMSLTISPSSSAGDLGEELLKRFDNDFMKKYCGAVQGTGLDPQPEVKAGKASSPRVSH